MKGSLPPFSVNMGTRSSAAGLCPLVKRCEQVRLSEWMKQAERDSQHFKDGLPAVFHRRSREGWRVTMNLADFMRLYDRQKAAENAD